MNKILPIIKNVLIGLLLVATSLGTLATAYIVFAPDTWPKPFYLVYRYPVIPTPLPAGPETQVPAQPVSSAPKPTLASAPVEIRPGQGIMVDTGTKIVNLMDPTGRRYLRAGIVLEFAPKDLTYYSMDAEEQDAFEEEFKADVETRIPVINDTIISLLSSQTFESVYTAEGKESLRSSIQETLNSQLPEYRVIFVYFTEFVVQ
ncbi:MAG: hypothetical protein GX495_16450 [Chloroflexi bacterium]|jgi:flagellar FliL protein|nr:hypothetical protein [Chloroflexota bacterium]